MIASLLLAIAAQASAGSDVLTVVDLATRHHALEGRKVQVEGVLDECQPLSCGLLGQPRDGHMSWLSFDDAGSFDAAAQPYLHHRVIVEGTVLRYHDIGERSPDGSFWLCMDRCPEFRPLRVVRDLGDK